MKKVFASLLMIAATVSAFAIDYTAKATLTLKNTNGDECRVTIAQVEDAATAALLCAEMKNDYREIFFYAIDPADNSENPKKYEVYASTDLENLAFGFEKSNTDNNDEAYTLTATSVVGTIYLYDEDTKKYFPLKDNDVYPFNATKNSTKRFSLRTSAPVPGICHQNGKLEFTGYKGAQFKVVDYKTNAEVIGLTTITSDYESFDAPAADAQETKQYKVLITTAVGTADEKEETPLVIAVLKK